MILSLDNVAKSYQQGHSDIKVLKQLNLTVNKGETVAILGHSGAGKSTLLSLIAGLDHPTSGSVNICKQEVSSLSEADLTKFRRDHLGIVFQQFHLISSLTALENVKLPIDILQQENSHEKAQKALEQVGLGHRHDHLPRQLSGGESQRVAIARAFVVEPDVLLADEPSGNLDSENGDKVMDLLFDLVEKKQMTMILVTHNKALADRCQKQYYLHEGILTDNSDR